MRDKRNFKVINKDKILGACLAIIGAGLFSYGIYSFKHSFFIFVLMCAAGLFMLFYAFGAAMNLIELKKIAPATAFFDEISVNELSKTLKLSSTETINKMERYFLNGYFKGYIDDKIERIIFESSSLFDLNEYSDYMQTLKDKNHKAAQDKKQKAQQEKAARKLQNTPKKGIKPIQRCSNCGAEIERGDLCKRCARDLKRLKETEKKDAEADKKKIEGIREQTQEVISCNQYMLHEEHVHRGRRFKRKKRRPESIRQLEKPKPTERKVRDIQDQPQSAPKIDQPQSAPKPDRPQQDKSLNIKHSTLEHRLNVQEKHLEEREKQKSSIVKGGGGQTRGGGAGGSFGPKDDQAEVKSEPAETKSKPAEAKKSEAIANEKDGRSLRERREAVNKDDK